MKNISLPSIVTKAAVVHTVSYFIVGFFAFTFLDYTNKYADPVIANYMRQTNDPLVAAGPLFQLLRGVLFGIVFYLLRELIFTRKWGWLVMWAVLVIVGVLSPFGAAPSSIEGMLYSVLPAWYHLAGLPEVLVQAGVLSFLTVYWVNHPEKKWLNWALGILLVIVLLLSVLGTLSAVGMLPKAG